MSRHAQQQRRDLAQRWTRIGLAAAFATVQGFAAFAVENPWLGIALLIMTGWNIGLLLIGLITLRETAPRASRMPR